MRYLNAPLSQLIEEIARATGEVFIADSALTGRFTITIPRKVTKSEALAVLEAALSMQGYATLVSPSGARQVLQVTDAASGAPWRGRALDAERPYLITTMVSLESAPVQDVIAGIGHLIGKSDAVVAYPPSNSLILTGSERRLARIIELAQALDAASDRDVWIKTLRYRQAGEISEMLQELIEFEEVPGLAAPVQELQVMLDERTNSVVVVGTRSELDRIRAILEEIDRPESVDTSVRVVRIEHRDAEDIAELLVAMAVGRAFAHQRPELEDALFGKEYVVAHDNATNSLVIDADPDTWASISEMIERLDRPQPRIQVDVTAWEVSNPKELDLGFDWFLPVITPDQTDGTALTFSSNPSGGGLRGEIGPDLTFFGRLAKDPIVLPFVDPNGNVVDVVLPRETVVITANDRAVQTRVVLQPRLLMTSGEEQRIFVGQNVPIPTGAPATSGVETRSTIERQDVGVELRVTPTLGETGPIQLEVSLEVSRVGPSVAGDTAQVGPTLEKRQIQTKIRLADGGLAVIGMSQEGSGSDAETSAPFLREIPILGLLTSSSSGATQDAHLVFAVQARVLRTQEEDLAESIRQRLAMERNLSRVEGLSRIAGEPYAVLVATRSSAEEAAAVAEPLREEGAEVQIGRWSGRDQEHFDVYLTGYRSLDHAGGDALDLRERGFAPQVVVLPGGTALAQVPPLRFLGSRAVPSAGEELEPPESPAAP